MADTENSDESWIRVRMKDAALRGRWAATLEARKISQQEAVIGMIERAVEMEPAVQAILFGQVPSSDRELIRHLLQRYAVEPVYGKLGESVGKPGTKKKGKGDANKGGSDDHRN